MADHVVDFVVKGISMGIATTSKTLAGNKGKESTANRAAAQQQPENGEEAEDEVYTNGERELDDATEEEAPAFQEADFISSRSSDQQKVYPKNSSWVINPCSDPQKPLDYCRFVGRF